MRQIWVLLVVSGTAVLSACGSGNGTRQDAIADAPSPPDAGVMPDAVDVSPDLPVAIDAAPADVAPNDVAPNDVAPDTSPMAWTRRGTSGVAGTDRPAFRSGHAMAYDEARGKVVLFGGKSDPFYCPARRCAETWEWDGNAGRWQKMPAADGGAQPAAREQHVMTYDPVRHIVLLFGGDDGAAGSDGGVGAGLRQDSWEWNGTNWTEVTPAGAKPSPRQNPGLVWDRHRSRAVLFGGGDRDGAGPKADTWEWDGVAWLERSPTTSPSARQGGAMAYDPDRRTVVMFGGSTGYGWLDDTWEWNGATGKWVPLTPASGRPSKRVFARMEYDSGRGCEILYGGSGSGLGTTPESWAWCFGDSTWTDLGATASMTARSYHAMVYDSGRGKLVVFAGVSGGGSIMLDDLWEM